MKNIIHLIGIENNTFCAIKHKLVEIAESLGDNILIEEIVDVDEIVSYNLRRIPAIAINKKVIFQQKKKQLEIDDLAALIQPYL